MGRKVAGFVALVVVALVLGLGGHAVTTGSPQADGQTPAGTATVVLADGQTPAVIVAD
ncbi:hypothetical protein ACWGLF_46180 [Streptomyces puniciscabiei]